MKKRDKKTIALLTILIILLVFVICIFIVFINHKINNTGEKNKTNYKDEKLTIEYKPKGKYEPSVINSEYKRMDSDDINNLDVVIDMVVKSINEKDYSKLYNLLPNIYKTIKFSTLDEFKDYINNAFTTNNYKCSSYRLESGKCYIKLFDETNEKQNVVEVKIKGYLDSEYTQIYFENLEDYRETSTLINLYGLSVNMSHIIEYDDKMSVILNLSNETSKNISLNIEQLKLITVINGTESEITTNKQEEVNISAGNSKKIEVIVSENEKILFLPVFIEVRGTVNGEKYDVNTTITYPEDE